MNYDPTTPSLWGPGPTQGGVVGSYFIVDLSVLDDFGVWAGKSIIRRPLWGQQACGILVVLCPSCCPPPGRFEVVPRASSRPAANVEAGFCLFLTLL